MRPKLQATLVLVTCLFLSACSIPRIVILSDPLTAQEHNDLGASYELMGEKDLALREYEAAADKDRAWEQPLINHGNVHAGLGNWCSAESSYRKALRRNPENPEAMNNLAYVLLKQEKTGDALVWAGRAVKAQPENPYFLNTYGQAHYQAGNFDMAKAILLQALEHSSDNSTIRKIILQRLEQLL